MASKNKQKDYGNRQFNKMVKALKMTPEEVIDLIGGVRRNRETGQVEHHKKGGPVVKARVGKGIQKGLTESYKAIADKLKARKSKTKPKPKQSKGKKAIKELDSILEGAKKTKSKKTTPKKTKSKKTTPTRLEAKLVEGAGDMSDPTNRAGKMRAGAQQRRGGATSQARDAMSDREKDSLARSKARRGSYQRSLKLKKGSLAQLSDEFYNMSKGYQRGEIRKGSKSKYYKVFKARNPKIKKTGGPVVKARIGGPLLKAGKAVKRSIFSGSGKPKRKTIKKTGKKTPNTPTNVKGRKKDPTQMSPAEYNIMMRKRKIEKDQDLRGADDPRNYPGKPFSNVKKQADKKRNIKRKGGGPVVEARFGKLILEGNKALKKLTNKKPKSKKRPLPKPKPISKYGKAMVKGRKVLNEIAERNKKKQSKKKLIPKLKRKRAGGGKITYRMTGGQVVDAGYD